MRIRDHQSAYVGGVLLLLILVTCNSCILFPGRSPSAIITTSNSSGEAPLNVLLSAEQSFDPDGDSMSYEWFVPDRGLVKQMELSHTFVETGEHTVELIVTDSRGNTARAYAVITVFDPADETTLHEFDPKSGTSLDTASGLAVQIDPGAVADSFTEITVRYYANPPQPDVAFGEMLSAYSIDLIDNSVKQPSPNVLARDYGGVGITLTFDIHQETPLAGVLILYKTDQGWTVAPNLAGPDGGSINRTNNTVSITVPHFSDYAVYGISPNDAAAILSSTAPSAVIQNASPTAPPSAGYIVVPESEYPGGRGLPIQVHVPSISNGTNGLPSSNSWATVATLAKSATRFDWWKALAEFGPDNASAPEGAMLTFVAGTIEALAAGQQSIQIRLTIQENSSGEKRAIVELGDPDKSTWVRQQAGSSKLIGGLQYPDLERMYVQEFAKSLGFPTNHNYWMSIEGDSAHATDEYVGYISLSQAGKLQLTPKVYKGDAISLIHFEFFLKKIVDVRLGLANVGPHFHDVESYMESFLKDTLGEMTFIAEAPDAPVVPAGPHQVSVGDYVRTTAQRWVRSTHERSDNQLWLAPKESTGSITAGPYEDDAHVWFQVEYDVGITGWTACCSVGADEHYIETYSPNLPIADEFQYPISGCWEENIVGAGFGEAATSSNYSGKHLAEDVETDSDTKVFAAADGKIRFAGNQGGYGKLVIIEHSLADGTSICSLYGHVKPSSNVTPGTEVNRGDQIGTVLDPKEYDPDVFPCHIHFGIRKGGYSTEDSYLGHWLYVGYSQSGSGCTEKQYVQMWYKPSDFIESNGGVDCATPTVDAPTVETRTVSSVGQTSALIRGRVNNDGSGTILERISGSDLVF